MAINQIDKLSNSGVGGDVASTSSGPGTADSSDVSWFSAQLTPTQKNTDTGNVAENIVSQLSGSSEHLQKLSDDADRALKKASKSSDPKDVVAANRSLSNFYLESLVTTKLVSKASQAVEKLTNLQ